MHFHPSCPSFTLSYLPSPLLHPEPFSIKREHKLVVFLTLMISNSIGFPTNDMIHWLWLNKTPLYMYTSAVFQICTLFSRSLISEGYFHKGHGNLQLLFDPHPCLLNSIVCCAWWVTCPRSLLPFLMLGLSPSYPICSIQFRTLKTSHSQWHLISMSQSL